MRGGCGAFQDCAAISRSKLALPRPGTRLATSSLPGGTANEGHFLNYSFREIPHGVPGCSSGASKPPSGMCSLLPHLQGATVGPRPISPILPPRTAHRPFLSPSPAARGRPKAGRHPRLGLGLGLPPGPSPPRGCGCRPRRPVGPFVPFPWPPEGKEACRNHRLV